MYFTSRRPQDVRKLVIVDIGPETSARATAGPPGPAEPDTWDSIEQAARYLHRGNPRPGIHYYRWVVSTSLVERPDGALRWKWHPSVKARRSPGDVDWWAVVRQIAPPALVLRGEHSPVLDRDVAERMVRELPRGQLVEIPDAVHTLHEDNPDAVLAALQSFLEF
jgi:pimeloyl-ACP methyl ester carboxylesterase